MQIKVHFAHGLESSSQGTKSQFLRNLFPNILIPDYVGTFQERMDSMEKNLAEYNQVILVGSSFGGLMSAVYGCRYPGRVQKLILLAPAIHLEDFTPYREKPVSIPTVIVHGRLDDVVPIEAVRKIAEKTFRNLVFHEKEDGHRLLQTFRSIDWLGLIGQE